MMKALVLIYLSGVKISNLSLELLTE